MIVNCKISLCDPEVTTDVEEISEVSPAFSDPETSARGFVVELSADNVRMVVGAGQTINENDIIAYLDDIPLKSIMKARITEVNPIYIIGEYLEEDADSIAEKVTAAIDENG